MLIHPQDDTNRPSNESNQTKSSASAVTVPWQRIALALWMCWVTFTLAKINKANELQQPILNVCANSRSEIGKLQGEVAGLAIMVTSLSDDLLSQSQFDFFVSHNLRDISSAIESKLDTIESTVVNTDENTAQTLAMVEDLYDHRND